jgi:hypothetical protein
MTATKIVAAALLAGLALAPTASYAQRSVDHRLGRSGNRSPVNVGTCALSRSCAPGASINVMPYVTMPPNTGTLRLEIRPANAEVYVDGVYAGHAADFDGVSQRVALTAGAHRIEVRAEGYEQVHFDTRITKSRATIHQATLWPAAQK